MGQQVIAQVGGTGPVLMLPTHRAHTVLIRKRKAQRGSIFIENITTRRDAVTQRTIEIEKYGFDVVWHMSMLLCLRNPVKVAASLFHGLALRKKWIAPRI